MTTSGRDAGGGPGGMALLEPLRGERSGLDPGVRLEMERALGASFGDVVVHSGPASAAVADDHDAAAFTVGRHVVFGPGGYDPNSARGRLLLAHELAHVVQQRRGGGDPDAGERLPAADPGSSATVGEALPRHAGANEGHAHATAAQAALGRSTAVPGSTGVGIARQSNADEEKSWYERAKAAALETARDKTMRAMGVVEGVAMEGAQIVDTVLWAQGKATDAIDAGIDRAGEAAGLSEETRDLVKSFNNSSFKAMRKKAKEQGMVDDLTGAVTVSGQVTKTFTAAEEGLKSEVFTNAPAETGFFTEREKGQLEGAIGSQIGLAYIGVTEVQVALKVVSGLGAIKAITDTVERDPKNFAKEKDFWIALGQAALHVLGLSAASSGKKLLGLAVTVGTNTLSTLPAVYELRDAWAMEPGDERDSRLKKAVAELVKALANAIRDAISHQSHATGKGPGSGGAPHAPAPEAGAGTKPRPAATSAPEAAPPVAKPAPTTSPLTPTEVAPIPVVKAVPVAPAAEPVTAPAPPQPTSAPEAAVTAPTSKVQPGTGTAAGLDAPTPTKQQGNGKPPVLSPPAAPADHVTPVPAGKPHAIQEPAAATKSVTPAAGVEPAKTAPTGGQKTKPARPSDLKRKAEAAEAMVNRAEKRASAASQLEAAASKRVDAAKERLRVAQEAVDARQQAGGKPTKAQTTAVETAQKAVEKSEAGEAKARSAAQRAKTRLQAAKQEATARAAAHEQARAAAASKPAAGRSSTKEFDRQWKPKKIWKQWAAEELAARKAGTAKGPLSDAEYDLQAKNSPLPLGKDGHVDWGTTQGGARLPGAEQALNPLRGATDAELAHAAKTGEMPSRFKAEIEHKVPQRVGRWLAKAGVPPKEASVAGLQNDPSNLEPASRSWHETVDEHRATFKKGSKKSADPMSSVDTRNDRPLEQATDSQIAAMVATLKKPGVNPDVQVEVNGRKTTLRDVFRAEKAKRPGSTWEIP